jgi:drug/metabolite transporter (DMT)-like permease
VIGGLIALQLLWTPVNLVVKGAIDDGTSPAAIALLRWSLFALCLWTALGFPAYRRFAGVRWPNRKQAVAAAAIGACFIAPAHLLYYGGLGLTSSVEANVLLMTAPLFTAALAWLVLREKVAIGRWVAIVLGFAGAYVVVSGFAAPSLSGAHTQGNLMFLLGVIVESLGMILATDLVRRSSGVAILAFQVAGSVPTYVLGATFLGFRMNPTGGPTWIAIAYLVLIAGMVCFAAWYRIVEKTPVSLMVLTLMVQPPVAALLGYVFRGEQLGFNLLIGSGVIFLGLFLGALDPKSSRSATLEVGNAQQNQHHKT